MFSFSYTLVFVTTKIEDNDNIVNHYDGYGVGYGDADNDEFMVVILIILIVIEGDFHGSQEFIV